MPKTLAEMKASLSPDELAEVERRTEELRKEIASRRRETPPVTEAEYIAAMAEVRRLWGAEVGSEDGNRFSSENRRRLSGPGLRTFNAIADLWGLTEGERLLVLGSPSRSTYYGWLKAAREHTDVFLSVDTLTRISAVLGIHKNLKILFATEREGTEWLRGAHRAAVFGGRPPFDLVTSGTQDGLMIVRRFLDAARGGIYMEPNEAEADQSDPNRGRFDPARVGKPNPKDTEPRPHVEPIADRETPDRTDYEAIEQAARDGTLGERVVYTEGAPKMTPEEVERAQQDLARKRPRQE